MISVAIDGPAGAGKSTIAKALAKKLGYVYVDTGALYRTVALSLIRNGITSEQPDKVEEHLKTIDVDLSYDENGQIVLLSGENVSSLIRTPEVSMMASTSSALPIVRAFLLETQRKMAREHDIIMDGRDIGTVVLPDATVKIFLTADAEVRAKRRYIELLEKDPETKFDDVLSDVIKRDENDTNRPVAPLKPAEDSVIVNTSALTLDESIAEMYRIIIGKVKPQKMNAFYAFIRGLMIFITKTLFPMDVYGLENIPKSGAFIIASNHTSMSDVIYLISTQKRVINFMGKEEIFKKKFVGFLFRKMNVFPVKRGMGDRSAITYSEELLNNGSILGIFPEGTRHKEFGPPTNIKSGTVVIASKTNTPVLPAAIYRKGAFRLFRKTVLRYGKPIPASEFAKVDEGKAAIKLSTEKLSTVMTNLWEENR